MQVTLGLKPNLFLKLIRINLNLKLKIYLKVQTKNIKVLKILKILFKIIIKQNFRVNLTIILGSFFNLENVFFFC